MSFTSGNDINILQSTDSLNVGAGLGNDRYVLSGTVGLTSTQVINLTDTDGTNTLQLLGGLTIAKSVATSNAVQLTLSNGTIVNINGANNFSYLIGGDGFSGLGGATQAFNQFVTTSLGLAAVPVAGAAAVTGTSNLVVDTTGTVAPAGSIVPTVAPTAAPTAGPTSAPVDPITYTLTASAASANEGVGVVYTLTASKASLTATSINFSVVAADPTTVNNVGTSTANTNDFALAALAATTVSMAAGATTVSYTVMAASDAQTEFAETYSVKAVIGTATVATASSMVVDAIVAFSITPGAASANEGSIATFALANGVANTAYAYAITGVEAADVVGGVLSGVATTDASGVATISVALVADRLTEGAQNVTVSLPNTALTATTVVNDTSLNNVAPTAEAATASAAEKGAAVTGQLVATDVDGDALTYALAAPVLGLTVNANGSFSFDPALNPVASALKYSDAAASIVANFVATDALGLTATSTLTIAVTPDALTFKITADKTSAEEGATTVYTVAASEALATAMNVEFTLVPGNGAAVNTGTVTTNTADFATGAFNPTTVVIAATKTTAAFNVVAVNDANTELQESYSVSAAVNGSALTLGGKVVDSTATGGVGQTFMLTTGVDTMPGLVGNAASAGTDGNDTISALVDVVTPANTTLNALDTINGGLGTNVMNLLFVGDAANDGKDSLDEIPSGVTISNVQTMNVRAAGNVGDITVTGPATAKTFDVSSIAGLTALNVTLAGEVSIKAAVTTDIGVSGATNTIIIDGGKNVSVTDATDAKAITIGANTVNAGTITVTDTKVGTAAIAIDGGTDVTVTASGVGITGTIKVGQGGAATDLASGAVVVNSTGLAYTAALTQIMQAIIINGGKTISVTQKASSDTTKAADDSAAGTVTQGAVTIVAAATTTTVSVKQDAAVGPNNAANTTGGVTTSDSVKFKDLVATKTVIIGGLTLTATVDMTAVQVAAAFANLASGAALPANVTPTTASGDTQSAAAVAKATYTGSLTGFTTGAATGDTVVFTSTVANGTAAAAADTGSGTHATPTSIATGKAPDATMAGGVMGIADGVVDITGGAALTTVTVDGYAPSTGANKVQGAANTVLGTVSLANGGNMTISSAAATLALSAAKVNGTIDIAAGTTTLNATVNGTGTAALKSASATSVNVVAGSGTVTGVNTNLTSVSAINTTGFTGTASFTINGTATTYTGGAGTDTVTLVAGVALSRAIDLGDGNDTLVLAANTASTTAALAGGNGTDTLSMDTTRAAVLDDTAVASFYTGFERLLINDTSTSTLDLANLGFTNYVTTTGSTGTLTLSNLANNGTVVLTADATTGVTVGVKDAATSLTDVLNVVLSKDGVLAAGKLTATKVESIVLTATDAVTTTIATHTLTLAADTATALTIGGNAGLTLALDAVTIKLATIDGSGMTSGALTVAANGAVAMTITGGAGADRLTASQGATGKADVISGGLGNDTLVAGDNGAKLTGGAGNDIFLLSAATATDGNKEVNTYTSIEDFQAGDVLQLQYFGTATADATSFAKLTAVLDPTTSSFTNYVNAAIEQATAGQAVWFSHLNSSYVVVDSGTSALTFTNGEDLIVKLTGVDLSNASWNATFATVSL